MAHQPDSVSPEQLKKFIDTIEQKIQIIGDNIIASIAFIWLAGAVCRLSDLGAISGGEITPPHGIESWDEIDEMRFVVLPPTIMGLSIGSFVKVAANADIQDELAKLLATYYTESGRLAIEIAGLEHLYTSSD